jgi:hypothetical protein
MHFFILYYYLLSYIINREASQGNCCACLSAAGDVAEFMYSACDDVKMLQFNSFKLVPNIVRMLSDICQKASCDCGGMLSRQPMLRRLPHMDVGKPPFHEPLGTRKTNMKE